MTARPWPSAWQRFRSELRANPRKARALAVLVPILCAAWMPILRGGNDELVVPLAANAFTGGTPSTSTRRVDFGAVERLRPRLERLREGDQPALELCPPIDPFSTRRGAEAGEPASTVAAGEVPPVAPDEALTEEQQEAAAASALVLGGTFLSPGRSSVARIDGQLVHVGALFGVFALEEVGSRWVSLRGRHGRYKLEMTSGRGGG